MMGKKRQLQEQKKAPTKDTLSPFTDEWGSAFWSFRHSDFIWSGSSIFKRTFGVRVKMTESEMWYCLLTLQPFSRLCLFYCFHFGWWWLSNNSSFDSLNTDWRELMSANRRRHRQHRKKEQRLTEAVSDRVSSSKYNAMASDTETFLLSHPRRRQFA